MTHIIKHGCHNRIGDQICAFRLGQKLDHTVVPVQHIDLANHAASTHPWSDFHRSWEVPVSVDRCIVGYISTAAYGQRVVVRKQRDN